MQSIKNKVDEFSKSHPGCSVFLQSLIKIKEEEINKLKDYYEKEKFLNRPKKYASLMLQISKNLFFLDLNTNFSC